jgi:DNA invertase Pin-like site-specific DNA recombinase
LHLVDDRHYLSGGAHLMIASAEPLEPFESEAEKIAYCRAFLQLRGFSVLEPVPEEAKPHSRQPVSVGYVLDSDDPKQSGDVQQSRIIGAHMAAGRSTPPFYKIVADTMYAGGKRWCDRPEGRKLFEFLEPGDHLWITHCNRLGVDDLDSVVAAERIADRGVRLHILDFYGFDLAVLGPNDKAQLTIVREQIQERRQLISARTKVGMAQARAAGRLGNGVPPIGFRKVGLGAKARYKAEFNDQRVCNIVWRLRHEQGWSIYRICKELRARKVLIPPGHSQGRGWCDERVKKVIAHKERPFPDCPEGPTKMDDLLDVQDCEQNPLGETR